MKSFVTRVVAAGAVAVCLSAVSAAAATYSYVGSWQVDDGLPWPNDVNYTGQEAAAHVFGGTASDYVISTVDSLIANIDFMNWVSVIYVGTDKVAQDFKVGSSYTTSGDTSAFVQDNARGDQYTNYAFRVSEVPLPAAMPALISGLGLLGFVSRRRKRKAA